MALTLFLMSIWAIPMMILGTLMVKTRLAAFFQPFAQLVASKGYWVLRTELSPGWQDPAWAHSTPWTVFTGITLVSGLFVALFRSYEQQPRPKSKPRAKGARAAQTAE